MEFKHLQPMPPALRVFDAGMGDATVLSQIMRQLHHRFPTIPFLIVGKEISQEDVRISLEKMGDRFYEHPQTVLVVTNLFYAEAPQLFPNAAAMQAKLNWWEVPLEGIGIKLGIDSHGQFKGFVLLFQALSEGLRGGAPFSRRLGRQTLSGRTGTLQKAVQVQLGLKNRLHPTLC